MAKELKLELIAANLDHLLHDHLYHEYQPHPVNEAERVNDAWRDERLDNGLYDDKPYRPASADWDDSDFPRGGMNVYLDEYGSLED